MLCIGGCRRVAVVFCCVLLVPEAISQESAESKEDRQEIDEVVVTGSAIRGLPREYVASPVYGYSKKDMEASGVGSLAEYIQVLPQNFIGDLSEAATTGVGFGTGLEGAVSENQYDGFSAFSLRGLGSDATLTLLNGRRLPNAGMTETPSVSFIPAMLIEGIEIVPDGASATYGADAVGGVVNLTTRRDIDGVELRARGGSATGADKEDYQLSLAAGHSWSGGNIFGVVARQDRGILVNDPVPVGDHQYQIAVLPDEAVQGFFGGINQDIGDVSLSLETLWFDSDRRSFQRTLPDEVRGFRTDSSGHSVYSTAHWQVSDATSFDLLLDYHENESHSGSYSDGVLYSSKNHANRLVYAEARGQTELFSLPGGDIQASVGVQYRRNTLITDATAFFQDGGGELEALSFSAEAYFPLVGKDQGVPLVDSLVVSTAARHEDFGSPLGSETAPKIGVRWGLTDELSLRGSYSESFLVPKLRDRLGIAEQVSFIVQADAFLDPQDQDPWVPQGYSLALLRAGSNPDIAPQDAVTFTGGFDYSPGWLEGLSGSLGYYRTELTGRVTTPYPYEILQHAWTQGFVTRQPSPGQLESVIGNPAVNRIYSYGVPFVDDGGLTIYPGPGAVPEDLLAEVQAIVDSRSQNYATELTDGIDLDVSYGWALYGGSALLQLRGQRILTLERRAASGASPQSRLGTIFNPPKLTLSATIGWQRGPLSVASLVNHNSGFKDTRDGQNNAVIGSYTTASLAFGWDFGVVTPASDMLSDLAVTLAVANVFDRKPPRIEGEVLEFSPLNSPVNPRMVSLILDKRF